MKKLFTLLTTVSIGTMCFAQTVFQSNLSSWAGGVPTDWMGTKTSIAASNVIEQTFGATYGTSMASLIDTTTSHVRFTTQAVTVTPGETYKIEMWVAAQNTGDLRTNFYDLTNSAYGTYNSYVNVASQSAGSLTLVTQTVTMPATCTSAEFILSLRNTDPSTASLGIGILVDSVAISVTTPPVTSNLKIYDIQYTTNANGDSPQVGNVVTTRGVITGIVVNGPAKWSFFIQDSARAWNGLYIYNLNDSTLSMGDSVEVTGKVSEFKLVSATQPQATTELTNVSNITVLNTGNTLPTPVSITTGNANMEEWEGVLIKVTNAQCTSNSLGFGMWSVNDGSGNINADDDIYPYALNALVGTNYDVTGIGHYSFDQYKILPRMASDIAISTGIDELTANHISYFPNPVKNELNINLNQAVTVLVYDLTGNLIESVNSINNNLKINTINLTNGMYFFKIMNDNKLIATKRFIVAK